VILEAMKKTLILIISTFSFLSYSQNTPMIPMNGVLGLICGEKVQSLDYWEAINIYDFSYDKLLNDEQTTSNINQLTGFEDRFKQYSHQYRSPFGLLIQMATWLPPYQSLLTSDINFTENLQIKDREISTVEFYPPNCKLDYLGYSISPPQSNVEDITFKFFIKKEYWDKLDYKNKVFTMSHFIFGSIVDEYFDESDHSAFKKMRLYNSIFLSDQLYTMPREEFEQMVDF
jgi:hypothetical protein